MSRIRFHFCAVAGTAVAFIVSLCLNERVFAHSEFVRGVNWIYLPSGIRLLSTLLLGGDGAVGLLVANWLVNFFHFFPHDPVRAFAGGIIAAVAPYAVYRLALEHFDLNASLTNLTPRRLLLLALAYSVANPLLHGLWFALQGDVQRIGVRLLAMFVGDLSGALIILYVVKGMLALLPTHMTHAGEGRRARALDGARDAGRSHAD